MANQVHKADFSVSNEGSIFILSPLSAAGRDWVEENLPVDAMKWAGGTVVEHRFINDILEGIQNEGLSFVN